MSGPTSDAKFIDDIGPVGIIAAAGRLLAVVVAFAVAGAFADASTWSGK